MIRILTYIVIFIAFALVTFFGLGPVLFADGSSGERITTLVVVLIIYAVLIFVLRAVRRYKK